MHNIIWLTGYRGTGKTTAGEILARKLGWDFVDADAFLEFVAGIPVREIFRVRGEGAFRDLEERVTLELSSRTNTVVSTGGGVILREANRRVLRESGLVVWLRAPAKLLQERIEADTTTVDRRPNLTSQGGLAEIETLLFMREPLYRNVATIHLDTSALSPEEVADRILASWKPSTTTSPG